MVSVGLDRDFLIDRLAEVIAARDANPRGMLGVIEAGETREGRQLVPLGATYPFHVPAADWQGVVISLDGTNVRMVLLHAHRPNNGAFKRLVVAIHNAGLRPVIVEPTGPTMPAIMKRWGWKRRVRSSGWERTEEWSPRSPAPSPVLTGGR